MLSDYLDHQPVEDYHPMRFDFPDKDIMFVRDLGVLEPERAPEPGSRWTVVFDGASNAQGNGIGEIINFHCKVMFQLHQQYGRVRSVHLRFGSGY